MKIFVLTSRIPYPLEKGDKLRVYHQLKELSGQHDIHLCCLSAEKYDQRSVDHLQAFCSSVDVVPLARWKILFRLVFAVFSSRPFQVHYFMQMQAFWKVQALIQQYKPDHIFCQLIRCSEYVKDLHEVPKTLDYMDAFSMGMQRLSQKSSGLKRWLWQTESKRLLRYENLIFDYFDNHCIISAQDRDHIYHQSRKSIEIIPNGVDVEFFQRTKDPEPKTIVFTGNMSYPPNVDGALFLANEIMPEVWKEEPEAKLVLAGATPHSKVQSLASDRIEVTGWMDDIRDAYNRATIFVAPMRIGTGLQNKLLEAMSMSIPSITSPLANNALQATENKEIITATSAIGFAQSIRSILGDETLQSTLAESGRAFVEQNYSWAAATSILTEIMTEL